MGPATPIFRIFDVDVAHRFYLDGLGFAVDWEHRFEPGLPLYEQISRDGVVLHLSQHYGDGSPNGAVWIPVQDVRALYEEFATRWDILQQRPGFETEGPGGPGFSVVDPFANQLRFAQPPAAPA